MSPRRQPIHTGISLLFLLLLSYPLSLCASAQPSKAPAPFGTYRNPIMPADVSDLDAIRVGADFYAITSTFQYAPGIAILHSRDLVHWAIIGHVVADLTTLSPQLNWNTMARAGRGIWAGSIRLQQGRFVVVFGTPDEGIFTSSSPDITGPWTPPQRLLSGAGWDDPCPFWDDDGQAYLVATRFAPDPVSGTPYVVHLFRMNAAGDAIDLASDQRLHHSRGSEANKLYKIHGQYFHFFSEVHREGRVPMMERASSLAGPWTVRQLMHVNSAVDKEPNQGGFVELADGRWYFVTHQGTGDWEGRAGVLLPVTWVSGWPVPGRVGPDGIGNMLWSAPAPLPQSGTTALVTTDDFSGHQLKPQWEWNYQPRPGSWSLHKAPSALRLEAGSLLRPTDFRTAANVLTQRALRTSNNMVTAKLFLAGMRDGQHAGLGHYAGTAAALEITQTSGVRQLTLVRDGKESAGPRITGDLLWLRSTWGLDGQSHFAFSVDGLHFQVVGEAYLLSWGDYRGDRVALFTFNNTAAQGFIDILSFRYDAAEPLATSNSGGNQPETAIP